jgi:putative endonuclease
MPVKCWYVYLLLCRDNSVYCGITNNMKKRLKAHNEGKGAKYTRGRGPLQLIYSEKAESKSAALRREAQIKKMPRVEKLSLNGGLYDPKAGCKHKIEHLWSGIKCSKCGGWFCL